MSAYLTLDADGLLSIHVTNLRAQRIHGGSRITLTVEGRALEPRNPRWSEVNQVVTLAGDVRGGDRRGDLLVLTRLVVPVPLRARDPRLEFELHLDLRHDQLSALEHARGGGPLVLQLDLRGHFLHGSGADARTVAVVAQFSHETSRDEWFELLKQAAFMDMFVLEVPFPIDAGEDLARAKEALHHAQRALHDGRWADAVTEARRAIEAVQVEAGDLDRDGTPAKKKHARSKDERLQAIRGAVKDFANPSVHQDDVAAEIRASYDRHDALGVVALAAALVRWAALRR